MQQERALLLHVRDCRNPACDCGRAATSAAGWFQRTPIAQGAADSWLRLHVPEPGGVVTWSCVICHGQANAAARHADNRSWLKWATFTRHQETLAHKRAAAAHAGAPPPTALAPAREVFRAVLHEHQKGVAVRTRGLDAPVVLGGRRRRSVSSGALARRCARSSGAS